MFTIGSINWPKNHFAALRLYLEFLVYILESLEIEFSNYQYDPIRITKQFLNGELSQNERVQAAEVWWDYIDSSGAIREFQDRDVLMARLAICLLSVGENDFDKFGDNLSWFYELLGFWGADLDRAIKLMEAYFRH